MTIPAELERMPIEEFRRLAKKTQIGRTLLEAAGDVLCGGMRVKDAAHDIGVYPSVLHNAINRLLDLRDGDPHVKVFQTWLKERIAPAEPYLTRAGTPLPATVTATELMRDLEEFAPELSWGKKRFGVFMRDAGHWPKKVNADTMFEGILIRHQPGEDLSPSAEKRKEILKRRLTLNDNRVLNNEGEVIGRRMTWIKKKVDAIDREIEGEEKAK